MASDDQVTIPTIRGRIAERLRRATPRNRDDEDTMVFPDSVHDVVLRTPEERGVVALACLILENLREHGGTRAPKDALETVLRRTLATFGPKEVMDLEVEAYEIMLWIGSAIDPDWSKDEKEREAGAIAPSSSLIERIEWAIRGQHDLEMDYYSRGRGELTHRRISPISFEAETYVHAYCHLRRDERVFRISRIGDLKPVGGWPRSKKSKKSKQTQGPASHAAQDQNIPSTPLDGALDDKGEARQNRHSPPNSETSRKHSKTGQMSLLGDE